MESKGCMVKNMKNPNICAYRMAGNRPACGTVFLLNCCVADTTYCCCTGADENLRVMEVSGNAVVNAMYEARATGYQKKIINSVAVKEEKDRCNFVVAKCKKYEILDVAALTAYVKEFNNLKIFSNKKTRNSGVADSKKGNVKKLSLGPSLLLKLVVALTKEAQLENQKRASRWLLWQFQWLRKYSSSSPRLIKVCDHEVTLTQTNFAYLESGLSAKPEVLMSDSFQVL